VGRLDLDGLEEIDRALLIYRALTLGWLAGHEAGTADGIRYAADWMQTVLDGRAA
jgi:hypothetical protein